MTLQGWTNPLPEYIIKAIEKGEIKIHQAKDYQYLIGKTIVEHMIVEFN